MSRDDACWRNMVELSHRLMDESSLSVARVALLPFLVKVKELSSIWFKSLEVVPVG